MYYTIFIRGYFATTWLYKWMQSYKSVSMSTCMYFVVCIAIYSTYIGTPNNDCRNEIRPEGIPLVGIRIHPSHAITICQLLVGI